MRDDLRLLLLLLSPYNTTTDAAAVTAAVIPTAGASTAKITAASWAENRRELVQNRPCINDAYQGWT